MKQGLLEQLKSSSEFFQRSTSCLSEENSGFRPAEGTFTAAQQVAHVAQTIDWFIDGMFDSAGFDMNFEEHLHEILGCTSLAAGRELFRKAIGRAIDVIGSKTDQELMAPLPEGPIMGGAPRAAVISAILDHTAHHRGALTVYSRLVGKIPKMPYGE